VPQELHPLTLHFAVALLVAGPAFDAAGLLLHREALLTAGRWNTLTGAAILLVTALSGLSAESALGPHSAAGAAILSLHKALGLLLLPVWLPLALWRFLGARPIPRRLRLFYLTLSYVGATLVIVEALLGSAMIYRHGVGLSAAARAEPIAQPARMEAPR
jgi:uncharacterized membrane protein